MTEPEPLDPYTFGAEQKCFACGPHNPVGFRLRFWRDGDTIITRFVPRLGYEGPPNMLHGGLSATIADELAAWTLVGLRGRMGFTASMELRLVRPVRLDREVVGTGVIVKDHRRLILVAVTLTQDGSTALEGKFLMAIPDAAGAERVLGQPLPVEWKRFCR